MDNKFVTTTLEGLSAFDIELVKLEQGPRYADTLSTDFGQFHKIRGASGLFCLPYLKTVAHNGEDVPIYFDRETKAQVSDRIAKLMPVDGVLFLGGAETVLVVPEAF